MLPSSRIYKVDPQYWYTILYHTPSAYPQHIDLHTLSQVLLGGEYRERRRCRVKYHGVARRLSFFVEEWKRGDKWGRGV